MREAIAILVFYLGLKIPWSNSFFFMVSLLLSMAAMLFLILCIVEHLFVPRRHRIGDPVPPDVFDDDDDDNLPDLRDLNDPNFPHAATKRRR